MIQQVAIVFSRIEPKTFHFSISRSRGLALAPFNAGTETGDSSVGHGSLLLQAGAQWVSQPPTPVGNASLSVMIELAPFWLTWRDQLLHAVFRSARQFRVSPMSAFGPKRTW